MKNAWETLSLWITVVLAGIGLLAMFSLLLPLLAIIVFPLLIGFFLWLLVTWLRSLSITQKTTNYDETGARYTRATIVAKESITSELGNGKNNTKPS